MSNKKDISDDEQINALKKFIDEKFSITDNIKDFINDNVIIYDIGQF
jgi:hypothetical protein